MRPDRSKAEPLVERNRDGFCSQFILYRWEKNKKWNEVTPSGTTSFMVSWTLVDQNSHL